MTHLLLTVRFLDDRYHGLLDRGGPPEWPPSPFRLFQALVAGVGRRGELDSSVGQSLGWLQKLEPPIIIAPKSKTGQAITRFVPNNDGDKKFDRQARLTAKPTIPTLFLLEPDQKPEVHYLWDISACDDAPVDRIRDAARSLTALGWGIDMAFADADRADEGKLQMLKGIRWYPKPGAWSDQGMLRTPTYDPEMNECTLCDLRHCHATAINRIEQGKPLKTVDKPKVFDRVLYTSTERPIARPYAVFTLLDENRDPARYSHAKLVHIAGMVRHVAIERMKKDPAPFIREEERARWLETFVCGHRGDAEQHRQISYVPLPSIGHEHADAMVRNVMLIAPHGAERELEYVAERIDGEKLNPEDQVRSTGLEKPRGDPAPMYIERFTPPRGKFIEKNYLGILRDWQAMPPGPRIWRTVTPVILPGHDDHKAAKTAKLICKALAQSGIEQRCQFTWSALPNFKNCLTAHKYDRQGRFTGYHRPAHLKAQTAVHMRLEFDHPFPGPLTVGSGRHRGLGLFAAAE